jgi:BED zinc finger
MAPLFNSTPHNSQPTSAFGFQSSPPQLQSEQQETAEPLANAVLTGRSPSPPDSLPRSKCNTLVLWDSEKRDVFQSWFTTTPYYNHIQNSNANDPNSKLRSPEWGSVVRRTGVWKHFDEGAETRQGRAKVICKLCGQIMSHPNSQGGATTNMGRHLRSEACSKKRARTIADQASIDKHLKRVS